MRVRVRRDHGHLAVPQVDGDAERAARDVARDRHLRERRKGRKSQGVKKVKSTMVTNEFEA